MIKCQNLTVAIAAVLFLLIMGENVVLFAKRGINMGFKMFEDNVFMNINCSVPYVNSRKLKRAGIKTQLSLGQVLDLGQTIEQRAPQWQDSCLRDGLLLDVSFTVSGMCDNNFVIGNADLIGVCDITSCKCDKNYDVMADSVKGRGRFCFEKLSTGKCVDENVCATVGRVLFPQYYATQKTK